ncbi:MAG: hypothetical protein HQL02_13620 [Nitrospirae bacterium]|nr:hypothetical protein [Nitrospirota bacterium]
MDFGNYHEKINGLDVYKDINNILNIIRKLENANYISHAGKKGYMLGFENCYYTSKAFTTIQSHGYYWLTEIIGFNYLVENAAPIIVQITGKDKNGDVHCGTGILCTNNVIITCAHVIDDMKLDEIQHLNAESVKIVEKRSHEKN